MDTESATQVKDQQKTHWDSVADGWAAWFDWTERAFQPLTTWLLDVTSARARRRILDTACGAGYPALAMAKAVRPGGRVVATDVSPRMVALAAERARREHLDNMEFVQADAEALGFEDSSFDLVTNAYGLMFCPDPLRALSEAYRLLVPGASIAVVTWDQPSKSPFFTVIREAAASVLALREPRFDQPGPFRLASPDALAALLQAAGFSSIRIESFPMTFEVAIGARLLPDVHGLRMEVEGGRTVAG